MHVRYVYSNNLQARISPYYNEDQYHNWTDTDLLDFFAAGNDCEVKEIDESEMSMDGWYDAIENLWVGA